MRESSNLVEQTENTLRLSYRVQAMLECIFCHASLKIEASRCQCSRCGASYPICDGIPVLIDDSTSIFQTKDFIERRTTFFPSRSGAKRLVARWLPNISHNIKAKGNYRRFAELILAQCERPIVLVVGGSVVGKGMEEILARSDIEFVETDVSFGPRTSLICDAHQLPFGSRSFDGVLIQAVLEHVPDPYRCAEEVHRVLKVNGVVYAETPFMQHVHGRQYDFTRFTNLGHRRLFRGFEEISSGAACGPGMALAWSYTYFLLSFTSSRSARAILIVFARLTAFWFKYFDFLLIDKPAALDSASSCFFIGRKADKSLTDQELILLYKGAF